MKHRGEIVEKAVRESAYPITKLARKLGVSRRHIYNVFENDKVDWDTILDIGRVIRHDFTKDFPEMREGTLFMVHEPVVPYANAKGKGRKKSTISPEEELDLWKNRYIELLEKYNELLRTVLSVQPPPQG